MFRRLPIPRLFNINEHQTFSLVFSLPDQRHNIIVHESHIHMLVRPQRLLLKRLRCHPGRLVRIYPAVELFIE